MTFELEDMVRLYKPKHSGAGRKFNPRKEIDAMYDTKWQQYRSRFLKENSRCYACGAEASVVDHLTPHKGCERLFRQLDNHIPLCLYCHNKATNLFDRNYRPGSSIKSKLEWLAWSRATKEVTLKVRVMPNYEER